MNSDTRHNVVTAEVAGTRLDRALAQLFPEHSRNFLASLIAEGRVRVGQEAVTRASRKVIAGEVLEISIPAPAPASAIPQDLPLHVLYQDDHVAVVDKPAGLVVHPAAGHADSTLVNALLFHLDRLSGIGGVIRPGIVHRLDKETSGVLLVAKNDEAHRKLTAAWGTDAVRKEYLAVVYGSPSPGDGRIEGPIGRDPGNRKRMSIVAGGRHAVTLYHLEELFRYVSVIRCELKTGRTHQIRVHLKSIGHPIVGDRLYGGPQWKGIPDRRFQKLLSSFPRQALHASSLTFSHPVTGEVMQFTSHLPEDLAGLLTTLRGESGA